MKQRNVIGIVLASMVGTPSLAVEGRHAGMTPGIEFYCIEEHRVDDARRGDPGYRINANFPPNASPQTIGMLVDFAFHNGLFTHSYAGNAYWIRNVTGRRVGNAVEYRGKGNERWKVTPAGATKVQITGTGIKEPPAIGHACFWR